MYFYIKKSFKLLDLLAWLAVACAPRGWGESRDFDLPMNGRIME